MKERLPGYYETRNEINYLLFRLKVDSRVLQSLIKDALNLLKECNRSGSVANDLMSMEPFARDSIYVQQRIMRGANGARRIIASFLEKENAREKKRRDLD